MKNVYESPSVKVLACEEEDIITTSNEYELPMVPADTNTELPVVPRGVW